MDQLAVLPDCFNRVDEPSPDRYLCTSNRLVISTPDHLVPLEMCLRCPYANTENLVGVAVRAKRDWETCAHRGAELRKEKCTVCGGRVLAVEVYWCAFFNECTIRKTDLKNQEFGNDIAACVGCEHFSQK